MRRLFVSIPEHWKYKGSLVLPPQNFEDLVRRVEKPGGYWQIKTLDKLTGEILQEIWCCNLLTDNGSIAALKGVMGNAITTVTPANRIAIDQSYGYTTLAANIPSGGTVTQIQVGTLTGPTIPSVTALVIGAGTAVTLTVQLTQSITGAGTYTITSRSGPISQISAGANIRYATPEEALAAGYSAPPTADASSLSAPASYTNALASGNFTYTATTGYKNRLAQVTTSPSDNFSTTGSPAATAANYTAAWLVNANPVAATTNTFAHVAFDAPVGVSSSAIGQVTVIEKL